SASSRSMPPAPLYALPTASRLSKSWSGPVRAITACARSCMKLSRANCSAANNSESLRAARFSRVIATRNLLLFALVCVGLACWLGLNSSALAAGSTPAKPTALNPPHASQAIPWSQLGARAGADYQGDGLTVTPIAEGARFRCVFQRLAGEVTREGLWLTST